MLATAQTAKPALAQSGNVMGSLSYIAQKSTLIVLFNEAKSRLSADDRGVDLLSESRIASATEELNRILDDIREASTRVLTRDDAARRPSNGNSQLGAQTTASSTTGRLPATARETQGLPNEIALSRSSVAADGVQWDGEYDALEQKAAFTLRLAILGYKPHEFRVSVRCLTAEGPGDRRQKYTVLVAQLRNDAPICQKQYVADQGAEWVNEFTRDAASHFPRMCGPDGFDTKTSG